GSVDRGLPQGPEHRRGDAQSRRPALERSPQGRTAKYRAPPRLVAHHVGVEVHGGSPRVSAELPETGERFEGLVPPVAAAPCFAIRSPAVAVFTLGDYVDAGIMSGVQAELLRAGVRDRKNILVAGGTSTGKTTLVNAL